MARSQKKSPAKSTAVQHTSLLPPLSAVRMAWALTGAFTNDEHSKHAALLVEARLKDIGERAEKDGNKQEQEYVFSAIACMEASIRSLHTAYKGRELNFRENEKLREVYLESVREGFEFGKRAKDFVTSLPGTSIGGAGGITLASAMELTGVELWGVGIVLAAVGCVVNILITQYLRRRKQLLYVAQDYDRDQYYDRYISQVSLILTSLYLDIDRIHKNVFGQVYPAESDAASNIVTKLLEGVRPALCKFVHKHMQENRITPKLWSLCEAGNAEALKTCPLWEDNGA
jgi:hypothetical protein